MLKTMSLLLIPVASLGLTGCQAETTASKPEGPLYQCRGDPGYAPGTMESFVAFLDSHPAQCVDGVDLALKNGIPKRTAADTPITTMHAYIMDSHCNFLKAATDTLPLKIPPFYISNLYTRKLMESFPTGEYYYNVVFERAGVLPETTYAAVGFIRDRCGP